MRLIHEKISALEARLQTLETEKSLLHIELAGAYVEAQRLSKPATVESAKLFSTEEKIKIFMDLFRGRIEVFPKRWENIKSGKAGYSPACLNEWMHGICNKPKIKCSDCTNQAFISVTTEMIRKHLGGEAFAGSKKDYTMGVYPMLANDTCWFLAVDFDKAHWQRDVAAFMKTCHQKNVPASLERSRSGNGGHI